jgi:signal transduction histidine kinase/ActR/RegA family two-component response regulator
VVRDMEMDMVFNDGRVVHVLAQATPLFDEQGNVRGAVGANIDISPLVLARRALEAVDRQKNDFIATLAHELRNPLAPIRYAIAILKRDPSPASIEHVVRVVDRQAGHMAHLLDDLLDLSRITRNAVELRREPVELHAVLDAAVENAQPMLQEYGQTLHKDVESAPLWVHGDAVRLLQVVDNILSNACKYTGASGRITLRARREDDWCAIEVSDNGVGISEQQVAGLFTMFGQVDPAMGATKAGLGIGLAISRRLVELHGGTIAARSDGLGKGSTFTVRLPCLGHDAPARDPAAPVDASRTTDAELGSLQVLVVDDNIDAAETLRIVLALAGVKTGVAHSAAAAFTTAEAMRPDVVLLDLGLPDGNGVDVARRIRSTEWGRKPLLVALTGWGRLEDRAQTDEAGFDLHLVKPVDGDQVLALLTRFARSLQQ